MGALIIPRLGETATGKMNDGRVGYGLIFFLIKTAAGFEPGWIKSPKMRHCIPALVNNQDALFEEVIEYILIPVVELLGVFFCIVQPPFKNIFFSPLIQILVDSISPEVAAPCTNQSCTNQFGAPPG